MNRTPTQTAPAQDAPRIAFAIPRATYEAAARDLILEGGFDRGANASDAAAVLEDVINQSSTDERL